MPWSANDANQHITGLSTRQRAVWAKVANASLAACLRTGADASACEARALRTAAGVARRAPGKSVKVAPDGSLEILAIPFGGPFGGKDFDGEYFSERTDLALSWFPDSRPLLYGHGLDGELGTEPIGRVDVTTTRKDAAGWWVKAELDKSARYWAHVAALLAEDEDALFASSGALSHLVKTADDGEILRWPWVELSLTPTPSNPFATVAPEIARKHYRAAGLDLPPDDVLADAATPSPDDETDTPETTETPPAAKDAGLTYADEADAVLAANRRLIDRTRSLAELRAKESRRLSRDTRRRMAAWMEAMQALMDDAKDFMDTADADPDPPPAKAAPPAPSPWAHLADEFRATVAYYGLVVPTGER